MWKRHIIGKKPEIIRVNELDQMRMIHPLQIRTKVLLIPRVKNSIGCLFYGLMDERVHPLKEMG